MPKQLCIRDLRYRILSQSLFQTYFPPIAWPLVLPKCRLYVDHSVAISHNLTACLKTSALTTLRNWDFGQIYGNFNAPNTTLLQKL